MLFLLFAVVAVAMILILAAAIYAYEAGFEAAEKRHVEEHERHLRKVETGRHFIL